MDIREIKFRINGDERGSLVAIENFKDIPFEIKRVYYIFDTDNHVTRGKHAHKDLEQVIIAVSGSCKLKLTDGEHEQEFLLNQRDSGVYIGRMVWREMSEFSSDCVLLVLASDYYSENEYIRDYSKFIGLKLNQIIE